MTAPSHALPAPPEHVVEAGRALNDIISKMGRGKPEQQAWLNHVQKLSAEDFHRVYDWRKTDLHPIGNDHAMGMHLEGSLLGRAIQCRMSAVLDPTIKTYIRAHGECPSFTAPAFQATTPDGHTCSLSPSAFYVAQGGDNQVKTWLMELSKTNAPLTPDITADLFNGIALFAKSKAGAASEERRAKDWRWDTQSVHDTLSKELPPAMFFSAILAALHNSERVQASTFEMLSYENPFGNAAGEGFIRLTKRSNGKDVGATSNLLAKMLGSGIDLTPKAENESLLHHCAIHNLVAHAVILLEAGHDPLHIDHQGQTPMDQALARDTSSQTADVFRAWISKTAALSAIAQLDQPQRKVAP